MILILVSDYKTKDRPYVNGFVHTRAMSYLEHEVDAQIFVLNPARLKTEYIIENVRVNVGGIKDFIKFVSAHNISAICIHFLNSTMIKAINQLKNKQRLIIFVHGVEALKWNQRVFPEILSNIRQVASFCKYIFVNTLELSTIRKFLNTTKHACSFVTVSVWMKEAAEEAWECKNMFKWHIIPNIVDTNRFSYNEKTPDMRFKLLSIRPFSTGKYANDITADVIRKLSKNDIYKKVSFTWVGDGRLYNSIIKKVRCIPQITFVKRMLQQSEIPSFHKANGIFICPTRQDAQGVSMCEAMSSGLVPITLYNTAIPEFLPDDKRLVCYSADDMTKLILNLLDNADMFLELSLKCSKFAREKCGYKNTTKRELELIKEVGG